MEATQSLVNLFSLPYDELEEANLKARTIKDPKDAAREYIRYLSSEKSIKIVTVCFTDLEGRFHTLEYDKQHLLGSLENLTFDGSSIKGFSAQRDSDLRLYIDWTSFTFVPSDIFGGGKVLVFGLIYTRDLKPYESDFRGQLLNYATKIRKEQGLEAFMAPELEGYLVGGVNAEKHYNSETGFTFVADGGYFFSLPQDAISQFIQKATLALRAMGFKNEKAHPEVGPSQFEIDYSYTNVVRACDQVQLYKLVCRQVAMSMGMTITFLPKPIPGINGNGMHTNFSLSKDGKNLFYQEDGKDRLSGDGWKFTNNLLDRASELCLLFNSSVNSYRRLDPHFEAPNEIRVSANDRGALIRLPFGNERTTRIEIRAVSPDCNPYLTLYAILRTGLENHAQTAETESPKKPRLLPSTIDEALRLFTASEFMGTILGEENKAKYVALKRAVAERSPVVLTDNVVTDAEVLYHHEVTNQYLWNKA